MKHIQLIVFILSGLFVFQGQTSAQTINFVGIKGDIGLPKVDKEGSVAIKSYHCILVNEGRGRISFDALVEFPASSSSTLGYLHKSRQIIPQIKIYDSKKKQLTLLENAVIIEMGVKKTGTSIYLEAEKLKFISNRQETGWDFKAGRSY